MSPEQLLARIRHLSDQLDERLADPTRYYEGLTSNPKTRLSVHNSGGSQHTAILRPWELVVSLGFTHESNAIAFEHYLKSDSGRAFAKKHFV